MTTDTDTRHVREPIERFVDTGDGRIFVSEVPGDDPPIILMHGFPDDHRIYDGLMAKLAPRRTVAFDWLGYGRSDRSDALSFTAEAHLSELEVVLDKLNISRAVLVGHDASGPDAVSFAVTHPDRVSRLVLLNTYFGHRPSLTLPEMIRLLADLDFAPLAAAMISDEAQRLWLLQHTADQWGLDATDQQGIAVKSVLPQFFGDNNQPDALTAIRAWTARMFPALDEQDALVESGALKRLAVPVTIAFGHDDRYLNPSLASEIAGVFAKPALHLVPHAGHWPQHDQPETLANILKSPDIAPLARNDS